MDTPPTIDALCAVMHDAYEAAAAANGWTTQESSRKPWADVPEENKATMRVAVAALLGALADGAERRASAAIVGTMAYRAGVAFGVPSDATNEHLEAIARAAVAGVLPERKECHKGEGGGCR